MRVSVIKSGRQKSAGVKDPVLSHVVLEGLEVLTLPVEPVAEEGAVFPDSRLDGRVDVAGQALTEIVEAVGDVCAALLAEVEGLEAVRLLVVGAAQDVEAVKLVEDGRDGCHGSKITVPEVAESV